MNYIEWKCLVFLCCGCSQPCIPPSTGGQFKQQLPWGANMPEPYQLAPDMPAALRRAEVDQKEAEAAGRELLDDGYVTHTSKHLVAALAGW